ISAGGTQLSYGELNKSANCVAGYLAGIGIRAESLVGLCLDRSIEMVVAMLGVLKAGGAYVPLDSSYPRRRLAYMLQDSHAAAVITSDHLKSVVAEYDGKVICIDQDWDAISREAGREVETNVGSQNLAYIIYTSGSTGRPKGVAIQHSSAVAFISWAMDRYDASQLSAVVARTSICFCLFIYELFVALSRGGKNLLARERLRVAGDD